MKARKIITITLLALAAVAVVALALWRFILRSLQGILGIDPAEVTAIRCTAYFDERALSYLGLDSVTCQLEDLEPGDKAFADIMVLLEGSAYYPQLRSLLPDFLQRGRIYQSYDGYRVHLTLYAGPDQWFPLYFTTRSDLSTDAEFCPEDQGLLYKLAYYIRDTAASG